MMTSPPHPQPQQRSNIMKFFMMFIMAMVMGSTIASADILDDGKKIFNRCTACHSVVEGQMKIGPSMFNVVGRKAGQLAGYEKYSAGLKKAGFVWDEAKLTEYLTNPKALIPDTKMTFLGIKDPNEIKVLLVYLKSLK